MTFPPLPLELVSLIVDELALSYEKDDAARLSNGQNIALVSKAWAPLGTAVVWTQVRLASSKQLEFLLAHVDKHVGLARLVKEVSLVEHTSEDNEEASQDSPAATIATSSALERLWSTCHRTSRINVETPSWIDLETLLPHLALLQHLHHLELRPSVDMALIAKIATLLPLLSALTSLQSLVVHAATRTMCPSPDGSSTGVLPLRELVCLSACVSNRQAEQHSMQSYLLSLTNPSTLRHCTLHSISADLPTLDRIFSCPNLVSLSLAIEQGQDATRFLEHAFKNARTHASLRHLSIKAAGRTELFLGASSSLCTLLQSVPFVSEVRIQGLYVHGDVQLPQADGQSLVAMFAMVDVLEEGANDPKMQAFALVKVGESRFQWHTVARPGSEGRK